MQSNLAFAYDIYDALSDDDKKSVNSYMCSLSEKRNKELDIENKLEILDSLVGVISADVDLDKYKTERILRK